MFWLLKEKDSASVKLLKDMVLLQRIKRPVSLFALGKTKNNSKQKSAKIKNAQKLNFRLCLPFLTL